MFVFITVLFMILVGQQRLPELMNKLHLLKAKKRVPMEKVSARLGIDIKMDKPSLLRHVGGEKKPSLTSRCAFPVQPIAAQREFGNI